MRPQEWARQQLAGLLRARVAGPDAERRAREIWGSPGERWFSEADPIWAVNQDPAMYSGGVCALFLQSLHPGPMAGVAQHDNYQGDPWGRLQRIANHIAITTYAPIPMAEQQLAVVRRVHDFVTGTDHQGRPYSANDPHLLRWVAVAETWSFLNAYQRWGRGHLSDHEADVYVAQSALAAQKLGATGLPTTVAELDAQLEDFRPELETTDDALEVVDFLVHRAPVPALAKPGFLMVVSGGIGLLPPWAREMLQLPDGPARRAARAANGAAATRTVGWALVNRDGTHNR